jgi:hypothetical protein
VGLRLLANFAALVKHDAGARRDALDKRDELRRPGSGGEASEA